MELETIINYLPTVGFPCLMAVVLIWYMYNFVNTVINDNRENLKEFQQKADEREKALYQQLAEAREINSKAIATIDKYADKIGDLHKDITEVKNDVVLIKARIE